MFHSEVSGQSVVVRFDAGSRRDNRRVDVEAHLFACLVLIRKCLQQQ